MLITYARSSSVTNYDYCPLQWFINYNLGISSASNKKADMGTTAHKVYECLAALKKFIQDNPDEEVLIIEDDALGKLEYTKWDFYEVTELTDLEVDKINKTRIDKSVYKHECHLSYGATRFGVKVVDDLTTRSIEYYKAKSETEWEPKDERNVRNWVWMPLEWNKGEYDPRQREIFLPEANFDIEIKKDWAAYFYKDPFGTGVDLSGYLRLKGTIDLITKIDDETLEVVDWKTGQRFNWATGIVKSYEDLCKDKQLLIYYYAVKKLFPEFKNIIFTIYFVRDGGPFTLAFDEADLEKTEGLLKQHVETVQSTVRPAPLSENQTDFRCTRLCHYYKNKFDGSKDNICCEIKKAINKDGINEVIKNYNQNQDIGKYKAPGT